MNTMQMLLTIGAVILMGLTVITVNATFSQHGMVLERTEVGVYATSLATSIIQEPPEELLTSKQLTQS